MVRSVVLLALSVLIVLPARADDGWCKFLWTELIAFDNTKADYGVADFLGRMSKRPTGVSLLLLEPELFEKHTPLTVDRPLPERACAYGKRPCNEEHARQDWTAFQLRGLVGTLKAHGVEVYASFFEFGRQHPTDPLPDGRPYVSKFVEGTTAFLRDYGFSGLHGADGFAHPRKTLAERGISVERCLDEATKWTSFWQEAAAAFRQAGFKTYLNTCWTRDPYEAIVRYGVDYRTLAKTPIDGFFVESSAGGLILEGWNYTEESVLDKCTAMLARLRAAVPDKELFLLHCFKDGEERFDALRHAPLLVSAEALSMANTFVDGRRTLVGVVGSLADAIGREEWTRLDATWNLAFAFPAALPDGVCVVWDDEALTRECLELPKQKAASSLTLLAALVSRGAVLGGLVSTERARTDAALPVLVLNPACYPRQTLEALRQRGGTVIEFGLGRDAFSEHPVAVEPKNWLYPLVESRPSSQTFAAAVKRINAMSPVVPSDDRGGFALSSAVDPNGMRRILLRNNRPTYHYAEVDVKGRVTKAEILTDDPRQPVRCDCLENGWTRLYVKLPPLGVVMLRIGDGHFATFEQR